MERTIEQLEALKRLDKILKIQENREYNNTKLIFLTFTVPTIVNLRILESNPNLTESEYITELERATVR